MGTPDLVTTVGREAQTRHEPTYRRMKRLNKLRLEAGWLFLLAVGLAAPAPSREWVIAGLALFLMGAGVRMMAAATLVKIDSLTTVGIYQATRNPLYLGNILIGLGLACFGGHWAWPLACLVLFGLIYRELILAEEGYLAQQYPEGFASYAASVPRFLPRYVPWPSIQSHLSMAMVVRNHEARNLGGQVLAVALLLVKSGLLAPGTSIFNR